MLHRRVALCAALSGLTLTALSPPVNATVDAVKLRQAVPLPGITLSVGYQATNGLIISNNEQDQAAQSAALKKSLTGGAEDAGRWQKLGLFYYQTKDKAASKQAYAKALALYLAQTQKQPNNELLLVQYGVVLNASEASALAEPLLRRAVRLAPQDAGAWAVLGQALMNQAFPALLTPEQKKIGVSLEQSAALSEQFKNYKPSPQQVQQARQFLEEAQRCFDKAVLVQPQAPIGYVYRAGFHMYGQAMLTVLINALTKENLTLAAALQQFSEYVAHNALSVNNPGFLADVRQAASAAPNNLPAVASAAMFEMLAAAFQFNEKHGVGQEMPWGALTPEQRQFMKQNIIRLEHIAQSKDSVAASQAANAAGLIWVAVSRNQDAERDLRLAVARDPHDQSAWDGLLGVLLKDNRYAEAAALAKQRIKTLDNAHTRIVLAKIEDKLKQSAEVQAQVQAALKHEPDDFSANLAQAVLLLRRSGDPAVLLQAKQQMARVETLYQRNQTQDNWRNYVVTASVYNALTGSETEARQGLTQVLATDKDNKEVAQVLAALGPADMQKQIL